MMILIICLGGRWLSRKVLGIAGGYGRGCRCCLFGAGCRVGLSFVTFYLGNGIEFFGFFKWILLLILFISLFFWILMVPQGGSGFWGWFYWPRKIPSWWKWKNTAIYFFSADFIKLHLILILPKYAYQNKINSRNS